MAKAGKETVRRIKIMSLVASIPTPRQYQNPPGTYWESVTVNANVTPPVLPVGLNVVSVTVTAVLSKSSTLSGTYFPISGTVTMTLSGPSTYTYTFPPDAGQNQYYKASVSAAWVIGGTITDPPVLASGH